MKRKYTYEEQVALQWLRGVIAEIENGGVVMPNSFLMSVNFEQQIKINPKPIMSIIEREPTGVIDVSMKIRIMRKAKRAK